MSTRTPDAPASSAAKSGAEVPTMAEDFRRMAPIYTAVIAVQVVVLLGLWWFQAYFG